MSLVNVVTGAMLLLAIPVLGVLISWPLWYVGTHYPALYSGLVAIVVVSLLLRAVLRRR